MFELKIKRNDVYLDILLVVDGEEHDLNLFTKGEAEHLLENLKTASDDLAHAIVNM